MCVCANDNYADTCMGVHSVGDGIQLPNNYVSWSLHVINIAIEFLKALWLCMPFASNTIL